MSIVGIITARGGSKGLPGKNIINLAGKPLVVHTIEAALKSKRLSRCIVSTDDPEIKAICLDAEAEVIDRPAELAGDKSLSRDAVLHVLERLKYEEGKLPEFFMLLQPTSPLRNSTHIDDCISTFMEKNGRSCVSVCAFTHSPYKSFRLENQELLPLTDWNDLDKPRQELPDTYRANGAMYLAACSDFIQAQSFFIRPVIPYLMGEVESIDVDCRQDLEMCEKIMKKKNS